MSKYLLGATHEGEIVLGEFGIRNWNGYNEFSASFYLVEPFTENELEDPIEYYENMLEECYTNDDKYDLCVKYDCKPSELAEHMMDECGSNPMDIRDCSLFPETINVDSMNYYFNNSSWGQCDTRNYMAEYTNKEAYDLLIDLWDKYHLKEVNDDIVKTVKTLQTTFDSIDVNLWIANYIESNIIPLF
jgi:hypothetical protein